MFLHFSIFKKQSFESLSPSAALIYYVLCVYISPPVNSFTDEAVYPPKTVEEEEERLRSLGRTASLRSKTGLDTPADEKGSDFV